MVKFLFSKIHTNWRHYAFLITRNSRKLFSTRPWQSSIEFGRELVDPDRQTFSRKVSPFGCWSTMRTIRATRLHAMCAWISASKWGVPAAASAVRHGLFDHRSILITKSPRVLARLWTQHARRFTSFLQACMVVRVSENGFFKKQVKMWDEAPLVLIIAT